MKNEVQGRIWSDSFGIWQETGTERTLLRYLEEKPVVKIPTDCTQIGSRAFSETEVASVWIHDGVKKVGASAFSKCSELKAVTLPAKLERIEAGTFERCPKLQNVHLPKALRYIGKSAFEDDFALKRIAFPESLEMIACNAFRRSGLEELTLSGVCIIDEGAFAGCLWLERAEVSAERIERQAFAGCHRLSDVALREGVMYIGEESFRDCKSLRSLWIPESVCELGVCALAGIPALAISLPETLEEYITNFRRFDVLEGEARFFEPGTGIFYRKTGGI